MAPESESWARPIGPVLTSRAYRLSVSIAFFVWGCLIIVVFCIGEFQVWITREDLKSLAETTAALAAVSVAILAYLQEKRTEDRYLKLVLAALTLIFLLATTTGWLSALVLSPEPKDFRTLTLRFVLLGVVFIGVGLTGFPLAARSKSLAYSTRGRPGPAEAFDFSFLAAGALAFFLWSPSLALSGVATVLSIGGMVYFLTSSIGLLIVVWQARSHDEELARQILKILKNKREAHKSKIEAPELVSLKYLRNQLQSNDDTLRSVISSLKREDQLLAFVPESFYLPDSEDWDNCREAINSYDILVVTDSEEMSLLPEGISELAQKLFLPKEVVEEYFALRIRDLVRRGFRKIQRVGGSSKDHLVYIKPLSSRLDLLKKSCEGIGSSDKFDVGYKVLENLSCLPGGKCTAPVQLLGKVALEYESGQAQVET